MLIYSNKDFLQCTTVRLHLSRQLHVTMLFVSETRSASRGLSGSLDAFVNCRQKNDYNHYNQMTADLTPALTHNQTYLWSCFYNVLPFLLYLYFYDRKRNVQWQLVVIHFWNSPVIIGSGKLNTFVFSCFCLNILLDVVLEYVHLSKYDS